jgi:hypothetical protein
MAEKVHDFKRTQANKIRRLTKELARNPNNLSAQKALEFWKTHERKERRHKK